MIVSIRMSEEEKALAESYAKVHGMTLSEAIKKVFFEKIEDEYDLSIGELALKRYEEDKETISHDELRKILDI